jgi:hypothetical protein
MQTAQEMVSKSSISAIPDSFSLLDLSFQMQMIGDILTEGKT